MVVSILHHTGQSPWQRIIQPKYQCAKVERQQKMMNSSGNHKIKKGLYIYMIMIYIYHSYPWTFLVAQTVKKLHARQEIRVWSLGRSSGEGHGNPLQYSCLENPMDQRSLAGYSLWGHKESIQLSNTYSC